jgi:uncharacterized membrane-anchored protein
MRISKTSVALLIIQLAIVSSLAAKYLYQRWTCPQVWARTAAIDPESPMRGRYLSLNLAVDGCQSTLPSAKAAAFPRDINGAAIRGRFGVRASAVFRADLKIEDKRLLAIRIEDDRNGTLGQEVSVMPGAACDAMQLDTPVDFYLAEHAQSPLPLKAGQELWVEVTIPPNGPPRPTQLALKDNGAWRPLAFQ